MTLKVFFVVPPNRNYIQANVAETIEIGREFRQKLGLLMVASHLRHAINITPMIIDCPANNISIDDLETLIIRERPDIVGFSVLTFNLLDCIDVVARIKRSSAECLVCFGGFHPTIYPSETLALPGVDFVVFGEGEVTFTELVAALALPVSQRSEAVSKISGLGWNSTDGTKHLNQHRQPMSRDNFNKLPLPAHDLLDISKYSVVMANAARVASIQTSRGCPGRCTFCDIRSTAYRYRDPEVILREIRMLKELGVEELFFIDDAFTSNRNRVMALCDALISDKIGMRFKISSRVDSIDPVMLKRLRQAGCYRIHFGVESGVQRLLDYLEKGVTLDQTREAFSMTKNAGIETYAYIMFGIPTETLDDIHSTIQFVNDINPNHANFGICMPFPKTRLYENLLEQTPDSRDYWGEFARSPHAAFSLPAMPGQLPLSLLRRERDRALRNFYGRPDRILRELWRTRSLRQLFLKIAMGGRILLPRAASPRSAVTNRKRSEDT